NRKTFTEHPRSTNECMVRRLLKPEGAIRRRRNGNVAQICFAPMASRQAAVLSQQTVGRNGCATGTAVVDEQDLVLRTCNIPSDSPFPAKIGERVICQATGAELLSGVPPAVPRAQCEYPWPRLRMGQMTVGNPLGIST